jgi:hypothetical protein
MTFDTTQAAYQSLRNVVGERTRPVVLWVGSQFSLSTGTPGWHQLKKELVDALRKAAVAQELQSRQRLISVATSASQQRNYWTAFQMLEDGLGKSAYREVIRDSFSNIQRQRVPEAYSSMWRLRVRGLVTSGLDRLVARAHTERSEEHSFEEFSGQQVARLGQVLTTIPFVANLYGIAEDSQSWAFTRRELSQLVADPGYVEFASWCRDVSTLVFVGMTADDIESDGHLERMCRTGGMSNHFLITHRPDSRVHRWAEETGLAIIRCEMREEKSSDLQELFADLRAFVPPEPLDTPPPVGLIRQVGSDDELPTPEAMTSWDAERIRRALNTAATALLSDSNEDAYRRYREFCRLYDEPIYRAWYTDVVEGRNALLGYKLKQRVAQGAFGTVFKALSLDGDLVAVKVLRQDIRDNDELLAAFRRGVRSMQILERSRIDGMVSFREASEIPALVAMEWVDGPNLSEAKAAGYLNDWRIVLKVATRLARIVRSAHSLPQRVLHRDLRPGNVMLRDLYARGDDCDVVVLDFDLSWHRGAYEGSVVHTTTYGYLAPEQSDQIPGASTRNATVDSFGLAMTLYFMCEGQDPVVQAHRHSDWRERILRATGRLPREAWRSVANRFARVILAGTRDRQSERWDMSQMETELKRLQDAVEWPMRVRSAELLAEELAARSTIMEGYEWDENWCRATVALPGGIGLSIRGDDPRGRVRLTLSRLETGVEEWKRRGKFVVPAAKVAVDKLQSARWKVAPPQIDRETVHVEADVDVDWASNNLDTLVGGFDDACSGLRFQ